MFLPVSVSAPLPPRLTLLLYVWSSVVITFVPLMLVVVPPALTTRFFSGKFPPTSPANVVTPLAVTVTSRGDPASEFSVALKLTAPAVNVVFAPTVTGSLKS